MRWLLAILAPIILSGDADTPTPPVDNFVSLDESTTFGPDGSIFDYSTRIAAPAYIGPPPALGTYANETDLSASACNSTTWGQLVTAVTTATDDRLVRLPAACKLEAPSGASGDQLVTITKDDIRLHCDDPTTCGITQTWPSAPGYLTEYRMHVFGIGNTGLNSEQTCQFTAPTFGSKVVQVTGCSMLTTGASAWGPGDIVRLSTNDIPSLGSESADGLRYVSRISCFYDAGGVRRPAAGGPEVEALCDELPGSGNNLVQLADPPPVDFAGAAYHWGQNVGVTFYTCTNSANCGGSRTTDLYEETSGRTFEQVERVGSGRCVFPSAPSVCGYGTETNNVAENIWFSGIGWDSSPAIGGGVTRWKNAFGGGHYQDQFRGVGRVAMMTFGGVNMEASYVSLHSTQWLETGGNIKSAAVILSIDKTRVPTRIRIQSTPTDCYTPGPPISDSCGWGSGDPLVVFDDAVAEPLFAGKHFLHTRVGTDPWNAGSPPYIEIDITGFDGSASGFDIDDTPGGYVVWYDSFGGASYYTNANTSNIQVINNSFRNPLQHAITQGCSGCVYAYNYVRHEGDEEREGRGPFFHGNLGQGGNIFEGNDQDQAIITQDTSNRTPIGNGEGTNNAFFKNRRVTGDTTTWPTGTATGGRYGTDATVGHQRNASQNGASNEKWSIFLNVGPTIVLSTNMDHCDNYDGGSYAPAGCNAPHSLKSAAIYHNKCGTCDLDAVTDERNTTTSTDIDDDDLGEAKTGLEAAWSPYYGLEPTSLFFTEEPEFFTGAAGECEFGKIGAYYDNYDVGLCKIPAQFLYEAATP